MSWESILGFIAIAVISSLFNKGKNQTTQRRTSNDPRSLNPSRPMETPSNNTPRPSMERRTTVQRPAVNRTTVQTNKPVSQQTPKRQSPTGGLEEMIRELQKNMGDVFNQSTAREEVQQGNDTKAVEKEVIEETNRNITSPVEVEAASKKSTVVSPILKNEIGRENIGKVKFDRRSILQGVIMSEVLDKPKSLKR